MNELKQRLASIIGHEQPIYPKEVYPLLRDCLAVIEQQEQQHDKAKKDGLMEALQIASEVIRTESAKYSQPEQQLPKELTLSGLQYKVTSAILKSADRLPNARLALGYVCPVCQEQICDDETTVDTQDGLAHADCFAEIGEIEVLRRRLQKAEGSLKSFLEDSCSDDTEIRNLVRPLLTPLQCDGNSNGVPTPVDIVKTLVDRLQAVEKALEAVVKRIPASELDSWGVLEIIQQALHPAPQPKEESSE